MPDKKINAEKMKLEEAMSRLDAVVKRLESEGADLEESLKLYEEGVHLVRICNERLTAAESRVRLLKLSSDGELCEESFGEGGKA